MEKIRLSKLMAQKGLCSRREADDYIERGWVFVDGERINQLGIKVFPTQEIKLARMAQAQQCGQITVLLHKPVGYVSGQPERGYKPAISLINRESQLQDSNAPSSFSPSNLRGMAPAGRLDIDSSGLLVFTQDGRIARKLIGAEFGIEKEYLVRVEGVLSQRILDLLSHGLSLDGKVLKRAEVVQQNKDQLRFILKEGRKRQIRRMCELAGLNVTGLKRIRIGKVRLGELPVGKWRYLRQNEEF